MTDAAVATWVIATAATGGVIVRPWRLPEAVWATLGATALVALGLLSWRDAMVGVGRGLDVYLFLIGMMMVAESARREGLFDWLAALAVAGARGSPKRLFTLVFAVGNVVTVLLSNDATAVVLTPAVYAATRAAGVTPLPYLFICAFIANAASFVLPISNPANLVIFDGRMPHLSLWLARFTVPSVVSVGVTYLILRIALRDPLRRERIAPEVPRPQLSRGGRLTAYGSVATATALILCSALDVQLGFPTFVCGAATAGVVLAYKREKPWPLLGGISWGVLPLVAGLFVLVEGLKRTGLVTALGGVMHDLVATSLSGATWSAGVVVAIACNLFNNLPTGLIASSVMATDHVPPQVADVILIAVDLGPNLSVTGSLATLLWLVALRREGQDVDGWRFLRLGILVMTPALLLSIASVVLMGGNP